MSPIANTDLSEYLKHATPLCYNELRTFFGCLGYALKYLHEKRVRHKDIKPKNILVHSGSVLLTDFGLSFDFEDAGHSTTVSMVNGMTPKYCAPEVAEYQPRNTTSDIWSLVFLEMLVTLKGRTVESMRQFFLTHGTGNEFVRENHGVLGEYVEDLKTAGQVHDDAMIQWIVWMLLMDKDARPTAKQLVDSMAGAPRADDAPNFCGMSGIESRGGNKLTKIKVGGTLSTCP
jgi:serine/threonine protein kinase